ncbi:MAG TPA: peptidoglycan-binding domain-containing protein [Candidatus Binatia bacterium]|nr:peptidoglycan-binding domain-containing protein [Candidatus Binatia bacterium]
MHKSKKFGVLIGLFILTIIFGTQVAQANPNADVESRVRASFPDMPEMVGIAQCESGFRQFNADGTPLRGGTAKRYIGIFQIDEQLHRARALSMAYDINTVDGNIAYARYMYFASGTNPWKGCLSAPATPPPTTFNPAPPANPPANAPVTSPAIIGGLTINLTMGLTSDQVKTLQQILNKNGFVVSASGPGSPGNETSFFGSLTREAVRKFQCAKGLACSGTESTTGYGRVGPLTRSALNQMR